MVMVMVITSYLIISYILKISIYYFMFDCFHNKNENLLSMLTVEILSTMATKINKTSGVPVLRVSIKSIYYRYYIIYFMTKGI